MRHASEGDKSPIGPLEVMLLSQQRVVGPARIEILALILTYTSSRGCRSLTHAVFDYKPHAM